MFLKDKGHFLTRHFNILAILFILIISDKTFQQS